MFNFYDSVKELVLALPVIFIKIKATFSSESILKAMMCKPDVLALSDPIFGWQILNIFFLSRSRPHQRSYSRSSERSSHRRTHSRSRERERRKGRDKEKIKEKERSRGKEKELYTTKHGDSGNIKAGLEHLSLAEQAKARLQLVLEAAGK
ncbi:acid-sensing ion channel 2-like [Platysternon megacephalum]|uniref:Acid-sensing ion channel 2-like n=1 Tax=Platysternon megacephalum TaxID=55544 RepID=A0A4D9EVC3_9SAUR|nr:acid-sensing ion channel 2-like [Platysternon megacephalum]